MVDIGARFGVSVGGNKDESDSSDAEFAPESAERDSEGGCGFCVWHY